MDLLATRFARSRSPMAPNAKDLERQASSVGSPSSSGVPHPSPTASAITLETLQSPAPDDFEETRLPSSGPSLERERDDGHHVAHKVKNLLGLCNATDDKLVGRAHQRIILCIGMHDSRQWAIEVPVSQPSDHVQLRPVVATGNGKTRKVYEPTPDDMSSLERHRETLMRLKRDWEKTRSWWCKYVPLYGVLDVVEVKVQYIVHKSGRYAVKIIPVKVEEVEAHARELQKLKWIVDSDDPNQCRVDEHTNACFYAEEYNNSKCPLRLAIEATARLKKLNVLDELPKCFRDPDRILSTPNEINPLLGLAQESCIINTCDIIHPEDDGFDDETEFRALMVIQGPRTDVLWPCMRWILLGLTVSVVMWKLITGEWSETISASTVLSLLLSLPVVQGLVDDRILPGEWWENKKKGKLAHQD